MVQFSVPLVVCGYEGMWLSTVQQRMNLSTLSVRIYLVLRF